jgi:integrase
VASIQGHKGKRAIRWVCPVDGKHRQYTPKDQRVANLQRCKREIERACDEGRRWVAPAARAAEHPGLDLVVAAILRDRSRALAPATVRQVRIGYGLFLDSLRWSVGEGVRLTVAHFSRQALADYYSFLTSPREQELVHPVSGKVYLQRFVCNDTTAADRVREIEDLWLRVADHDLYGDLCPRPRRLRDLPRRAIIKRPVPTWDEMDRAVTAARPEHRGRVQYGAEWLYRLFYLQRFLGLRSGQVRRLLWSDFDLAGSTLTIRGALGKSRQEQQGRVVPISDHLVAELATWGRRDGLVLGRMVSASAVRVSGRRVWARSGVRDEVWAALPGRRGQQTHAFRHGFVTGLRSASVDLTLIHYLVGHRDGDIADTYTYWALMQDQLRAAVGLIPALGEGAAGASVVLPLGGPGRAVAE